MDGAVTALDERPGCPSGAATVEFAGGVAPDPVAFTSVNEGVAQLNLLVEGARCAACIRKIEGALAAMPSVVHARLNLSTGRLHVMWRPGALAASAIVERVASLGYKATPFDPAAHAQEADAEGRALLRALAVAAFGAMNVMMFSVPVWSGDNEMGAATRTMLHWWSAIVAVPSALYAGQPFFRSAFAALRRRRANMDVPITLAVLLTLGMSLYETTTGGHRAYFDGACMLLFLLLIGRYLDHRLRVRARSAAGDLLALQATSATRVDGAGAHIAVAATALRAGDTIHLAVGDKAPADCTAIDGATTLDCALLTGETAPHKIAPGDPVPAGAINLGRPISARVLRPVEDSTVAQLAKMVEIGEQGRARFVRIADKAAALYVPVVHSLAAATFLFWIAAPLLARATGLALPDIGVHGAITNAIAVLIITCPCALGLAVPAVQIVATGRLFARGVFVKTGDALERLAQIDTVVLDKTGTLTLGRPRLITPVDGAALAAAATLARASRHPLSRALADAAGPGAAAQDAHEVSGDGVVGVIDGLPARLGRRAFVLDAPAEEADAAMELWFVRSDSAPVRFTFADPLRKDARETIAAIAARGIAVEILSGDRADAVAAAANAAGIAAWRADVRPDGKTARLAELAAQGRRVLMVGDGLNDAPSLASAHASASPAAAVEISQAAADIVFTGATLAPIVEAIDVARRAQRRVSENMAFSALYNVVAIPVAVLGYVTPLIAALAMSGSSLVVMLNALRLQGGRTWTS